MLTCSFPLALLSHRCSGYQHFGGRGQRGYAVVYSQEARKRALRWVAVLGAGGAVVWVSSRQKVPYTGRMWVLLLSHPPVASLC